MRLTIGLAAATALCAATITVAAPAASKFQLTKTNWSFTGKDGTKVVESIDADGNYSSYTAAGKHLDHGTAVIKSGKACFTSLMTKDGETCWTTRPVKVGEAMKTVSSKGDKLTVTREAYKPFDTE
jgi:hypothetical protein